MRKPVVQWWLLLQKCPCPPELRWVLVAPLCEGLALCFSNQKVTCSVYGAEKFSVQREVT